MAAASPGPGSGDPRAQDLHPHASPAARPPGSRVPPLYRRWRMAVSLWKRWRRWEFWPLWMVYPPLVLWILWLGWRHGGLSVFTAVNTRIWAAGVIGRSKAEILSAFTACTEHVARTRLIEGGGQPVERQARIESSMEEMGLDFPVVLKPDVGARGRGVEIVRSREAVRDYLDAHPEAIVLQEYVPGREFGIFYYRRPGEARGRIFSIADKRPAVVVGDGKRSLEALILADPRAVALAKVYFRANAHRLSEVPQAGRKVLLSQLGTHCRGAIFLDGGEIRSEALERAIDRLSQSAEGFFFGRYDLKASSVEALQRGESFKVLELNGLVSEAAHIYDPRYRLLEAYGVLFRQWRIAAEIGRSNVLAGHEPSSLREVMRAALATRCRLPGG